MTPYYSDDLVTIYHGDCREWMPAADVIVTDPPYGINLDTDYSTLNGTTSVYQSIVGDAEPFDPRPFLGLPAAFFGANHFADRLPSGTWHVWDKRDGAVSNMFADFEVWWTSYASGPSRIFRYQWISGVHPGAPLERWIEHPTRKPLPVMERVLLDAPAGTVLDPFMGSGSTLVAAKLHGRRAIGIEIEERYCEIAALRCSQEVLGLVA